MLKYFQTQVALGSAISLVLVTSMNQSAVDEIFRKLWLTIFEFEQRFSRFLPDSELTRFNRSAGTKQPVSQEFRSLLIVAKMMAQKSEGLYNPFVLPALQRAGYVHSMVSAHRQDVVDNYADRSVVDWSMLDIGDDWASIPYGTAIDLGGCGKGYAGDLLADLADFSGDITGYWFSLGGDIVARGYDEAGQPWVIGVEDIVHQQKIIGTCSTSGTRRYAVATSSITRRKGKQNGKDWHHIIDPLTGKPSETDILAASISASDSLTADVIASCVIIAGSDRALSYIQDKAVEGVLIQTTEHDVVEWGNLKLTR